MISISEDAISDLKIILDGLNFQNSYWILYHINLNMINCNAGFLTLDLIHLANVTVQNCTFGNWTFRKVQKVIVKNCNNVFDEDISTSLRFYNSSAKIENMKIVQKSKISKLFNEIAVTDFSFLHIEQSYFVNNTVEYGIIKVLNSSTLEMLNCAVLANYAEEYAGAIYANESHVHLTNTYFNYNKAHFAAGAMFITKSVVQIKNCTFKSNWVNGTGSSGGAIFSANNSLLDISYSLSDDNRAYFGGAIYQENGETKLNQCSFWHNAESAFVGNLNSKVFVVDSHFEKNIGQRFGSAVTMMRYSVLYVSHTTFKNNTQILIYDLNGNMYHDLDQLKTNKGGGTIFLFQSVANISEAWFYKNYASFWGGSICILTNSSISVSESRFENNIAGLCGGAISSTYSFMNDEYSIFKNNSAANEAMGMGGSIFIQNNSTVQISNVLFSESHASRGGTIKSMYSTTITMCNTSVTASTQSAMYLLNGVSLEVNNCIFSNNSTPENGGAIMCKYSCDVKMINTQFHQNKAWLGGAVHILGGMSKCFAHKCLFTKNIAFGGGALYANNFKFTVSESNFTNNTATEGGVAVTFGNFTMTNCHIIDNIAHADGAGIYASSANLLISNCLAKNNTAKGNGGVVIFGASNITIETCKFQSNSALASGGVIMSRALMQNSSFEENYVGNAGSVLSADHQSMITFTQSFCFRNKAEKDGGVFVFTDNTTVIISETEIKQN